MTMKMKKKSLITSVCVAVVDGVVAVLATLPLHASPAFQRSFSHTQSDGTILTIILSGDEDFAYFRTSDDIPLWRNGSGDFCYMEFDALGYPKAGETVAHERTSRSISEQSVALSSMSSLIATQTSNQLLRGYSIGSQSGASVNSIGDVDIPVILVEFSDVTFATEADSLDFVSDSLFFEELFNRTDTISVKRYFTDQSDGLFDPTFKLIGPVTLSQTMAYYGQNNSSGNDRYYTEMVREAVTLAVEAGYDLSAFATDGEVPFIAVVHAGGNEEVSGTEDDLWSRYQSSFDYTTGGLTFGSMLYVGERNDFGYGYEQQNGIGIFCHEFSHALGLPDMYTNTTVFGMDFWDLMDYGEFYELADRPTGYTAYERDFMGWLVADTLERVKQLVTISPLAGDSGVRSLIVVNPNNEDEYYVLSNLQSWNWFPSVLGYGMMINHINYSQSRWTGNRVNRDTSELNITLLPADGERTYHSSYASSYKGDLWPGYTNNTALSDYTTPADSVYAGDFMGIKMSDIHTDDDGNIVFAFMADGILDEVSDLSVGVVSDSSLEATWTAVENASAYIVTVLSASDTIASDTTSNTVYSIESLEAQTEYTVIVIAIDDDYIDSEATRTSVTTLSTSINELLIPSDEEVEIYSIDGKFIGSGTLGELKSKFGNSASDVYLLKRHNGETKKVTLR